MNASSSSLVATQQMASSSSSAENLLSSESEQSAYHHDSNATMAATTNSTPSHPSAASPAHHYHLQTSASSPAASSNTATTTSVTTPPSPVNDLDVRQGMIDISADRLEGLRTQCATSATLTQQEIRSLEAKLVRMFSELLLTKARLNERIPANGLPTTTGKELRQWLRVVGLSHDSLNVCLTRLSTLEQLLEQSDDELRQMLANNPAWREEEVRRLTRAMHNLRKCKKFLGEGGGGSGGVEHQLENLFWDSWDRHHHHRGSVGNIGVTASPRSHRLVKGGKQVPPLQTHHTHQHSGSSSRSTSALNYPASEEGLSSLTPTTGSPPNSPFIPGHMLPFKYPGNGGSGGGGGGSLDGTPHRGKHSAAGGTPPPMRKHQTLLGSGQPSTPSHHAHSQQHQQQGNVNSGGGGGYDNGGGGGGVGMVPLAKSKSNESQFQDNSMSTTSSPLSYVTASTANTTPNQATLPRSYANSQAQQLQQQCSDPSADNYSITSSEVFGSESNNNLNSLQVPRSPCTPVVTRGMAHTIAHRFTKVFRMMATCDLCNKQMFIGLKCKECKYRCHKDCEANVPPSCGLPPQFVDEFIKTINDHHQKAALVNTSPNLNAPGKGRLRHTKPGSISGMAGGPHHHGGATADSSSPGSSCNSSSPSSPALFQQHGQQTHGLGNMHAGLMSSSGGGSSSTSSNMLATPSSCHKTSSSSTSQFNFPDVTITSSGTQAAGTTQTLYSVNQPPTDATTGDGDFMSGDSHGDYQLQDSLVSTGSAVTITSNALAYGNGGGNAGSMTQGSAQGHGHTSNGSACSTVGSIASHHTTVTASYTSSGGTGGFYVRKLSSAGVDKRGPFAEVSDTHKSNDSDKTVSISGSTSASTDSDRTPVRLDSTEDGDSGHWPRQNSLSLKEWDIPYGDLRLLDQIGKGRFGTVHRALWHGDVAVKLLKEDYLRDEQMLEAFKVEVATFKKTRHENLVLFMGACMNPPHLAIITSLCKGNTLYTYIHSRRDKFTINKTTLVAQQISQGMGYLHARGILHKDLRTKNIFLENGKVIITDFGLFSSTKLLYCDIGLGVPSGWLCYLAPELMRALLPRKPASEILPFRNASDVYSFGTVWYELLCGEFPFKAQPPESIIWQVGRGMKQTLANLQTSRDVKDILMLCWSYNFEDRPDFGTLQSKLERLPKKRLARSPSHPVQLLSRSAESVF